MGGRLGMVTMDAYLLICTEKMISREDALLYAVDQDAMKNKLHL